MHPLLLAALIVLCEGLSLSALFPVVHAHVYALGGNAIAVGLLFALVAGPKVIVNALWGWAADRYGRRPVLIVVTLGTLAGSVGWALAPDLVWLAVARVVTGIFGAQAVLAMAIAADVSPRRRAAAMAAVGAAFGVALTLGPPLGGWLGDGWGYARVGWLAASFQLVSLGLIVFGLRETVAPVPAMKVTSGWRTILGQPGVPFGLLAVSAMSAATSGLIATLGRYTEVLYDFAPRDVGLLFGAFGLVGAAIQGGIRPAVARVGEESLGVLSLAVLSAGCVGLVTRPGQAGFWLTIVVIAAGTAAATTCLSALLSNRVTPDLQGRLMGMQQSVTALGRALGFGLGGYVFQLVGPPGPPAVATALALLAMVALLGLPRAQPLADLPPSR